MTGPPVGGPPGGAPGGGPPAGGAPPASPVRPAPKAPTAKGAGGPSWKERQEQAARASAAPGSFIDLDLERLITIGGEGLLRPRAVRGAPASTAVAGANVAVTDLTIDQGTPEFWVRYLFDEIVSNASKQALAGGFAGRRLLLDFYNLVFSRPDDFGTNSKPYVVPKVASVLAAYPAGTTGEALLCSHLRAALDLGFDWMQWPADTAGSKTASMAAAVSYMQEIQHKTVHTPLVWRTEDRRTLTELRSTGFTQQTAAANRITLLGMDQAWCPFSTNEVRGRLWYRRQNTDNCLYTGISVALNPFASLVFPKITLSPMTLAPVANAVHAALHAGRTVDSALLDPKTGEVLPNFAPYVARLDLGSGKFKLCLYSRARAILMALEGKYLDTQGVQSHGGMRSEGFPEYGSLGISGTNVFAQVELHRFFHGWSDNEGFTAFVNRPACEMVSRGAIVGCFGEAKARTDYFAKVQDAFGDVANGGPYGLAWAAGGEGHQKIEPAYRGAVTAWVNGQRISLR